MASPFDALNALRGIRTLAVRTKHQSESAALLAAALEDHPAVEAVHYPGLDSHPQHNLATRQMRQFGTVLAFEFAGGQPAVSRFLEHLRVVRCATSLGGPETLACHPMTTTHVSAPPDEQETLGVTPGLVRISVGLESPDDVSADIVHALAAAAGS